MLTTKAMPDGGLEVPRSAPNWNGSQSDGRVTARRSGEAVTSVPATVRLADCWPELGAGDGVSTGDGGPPAGETAADGAPDAGLQAVADTTIAAATKITLSVLVTDWALHADRVGRRHAVAASGIQDPSAERRHVRRFCPV
jgi:hypothetical protein